MVNGEPGGRRRTLAESFPKRPEHLFWWLTMIVAKGRRLVGLGSESGGAARAGHVLIFVKHLIRAKGGGSNHNNRETGRVGAFKRT